jgi:hypothetical protein
MSSKAGPDGLQKDCRLEACRMARAEDAIWGDIKHNCLVSDKVIVFSTLTKSTSPIDSQLLGNLIRQRPLRC